MAASATFALKVGVWFRRGRLFMVSPDSLGTACPLSGRNSTYRPVQISETSSVSPVCASRCARLLPPEITEPIGCHLGVAHGVLDILVAEIVLQRSRVVSVVGELVSTGVPQHVGVDTKRHLGGLAEPLDEPMKADWAHGSTTLRNEHIGVRGMLTPQLAQSSHFVAANRMHAWRSIL